MPRVEDPEQSTIIKKCVIMGYIKKWKGRRCHTSSRPRNNRELAICVEHETAHLGAVAHSAGSTCEKIKVNGIKEEENKKNEKTYKKQRKLKPHENHKKRP
jgi:hypothetical protein